MKTMKNSKLAVTLIFSMLLTTTTKIYAESTSQAVSKAPSANISSGVSSGISSGVSSEISSGVSSSADTVVEQATTSQVLVTEEKSPKVLVTEAVGNHQDDQQAKQSLMAKLAGIDQFSASFVQTIYDEDNEVIQQGSGDLAVSKPNLVNWHTLMPDESLIISDGENLWFYDPFVEQVSVYAFEQAIKDTPILLLTNNDPLLWQNYHVQQVSDNAYFIRSAHDNSRVKSLTLVFDAEQSSQLSTINIIDNTGQLSQFVLSDYQNHVKNKSFSFTVPEGVQLDDQR